jgi:hypothetical protein
MIHSKAQEILDWVLMRSWRQDRVVFNAMNNHRCTPTVALGADGQGRLTPIVTARSRSGKWYRIAVFLHPVTGEPHNFCRLKDAEEEDTAETVAL